MVKNCHSRDNLCFFICKTGHLVVLFAYERSKYLFTKSYLEHLQTEGQYWFLRKETIRLLHLSDNAFRKAVHRLMIKGKLNRPRGDFYTIVPPEYRATGSLPASRFFIEALMNHLNQHYYAGLLTAAAIRGAAHQQPMTFQVITNKLTRAITVAGSY